MLEKITTWSKRRGCLWAFIALTAFCHQGASLAQTNLGKNFRISFPLSVGNPLRTTSNNPSCIVNIISPRQTTAIVEYQGQLPFQVNLQNYWTKIIVPDSTANSQKAIYITAQDSIAVFPVVDDDGEVSIYSDMPMEQWGTRYIIPTLAVDTILENSAVGFILCKYDSTRIVPNIPGNYMYPVFAVNRDTISSPRGTSITAGNDITITASKPVCVLSQLGEGASSYEGHVDGFYYLIEPLSPEAQWGTEYYCTPPPSWANSVFPSDGQYRVHITAAFDSTVVRIDSNGTFMLNAGKFAVFNVTGYHHILASKRIEVAQSLGKGIMENNIYFGSIKLPLTLPAVREYLNDVYFWCPYDLLDTNSTNGSAVHYITIVHPNKNLQNLTLDGAVVSATWFPIGNGDYEGALLSVSPGAHHLHSSEQFMTQVFGCQQDSPPLCRADNIIDTDYYDYLPGFGGSLMPMISGVTTVNSGILGCHEYSRDTAVAIYNLGMDTLVVDSIRIVGADSAAFSLPNVSFPVILSTPDYMHGINTDTVLVTVRFTPRHWGVSQAELMIYSNDTLSPPIHVWLAGVKDSVGFSISDSAINFGKVATCASDAAVAITVTNTGNVPLNGAMNLNANIQAFFHAGVPLFPIDSGQSTSMTVHFTHLKDSVYTGNITLYTQCDSLIIPIRGEGVTPQLSINNADLGATCSGSSDTGYITLFNTGDTNATVTSLSIASPFTVDSPSVPFIIPAQDSIRVRGIFSPTADGRYSQILTITGEPCSVTATGMLTGATGTPTLSASSADFGNVCLGDTVTKSITLRNTGAVTVTVNSIHVSSGFIVLTQLPITINAGDSQTVAIACVPTSSAAYSSQVNVQGAPCNITAQSQVQGMGVSVALSASGVNFGTIQASTKKDSAIAIFNSGTSSITVQLQTQPPFTIDSASVIVPPGGSVIVGIHYTPTQTGSDTSALNIYATVPCAASFSVLLTGADTMVNINARSVELCSITPNPVLPAVPIDLPITLSNILPPVDSVVFVLLYDPTALLYETSTSALCKISQQRVKLGLVHIILAGCGAPLSGDIADAKFVGLISSRDTIYTQVSIDSVMFYPTDSITGSGCSVPVTINPLCGLKGVLYTGTTALSQNYPNPFAGTTTIRVTLSQSDAANAQLKVYNMLGEEVADLTSELSANADVPFIAEGSNTGVYYYVLQTASGRMTRQMFVVK